MHLTGLQFSSDAYTRFSNVTKWNHREPFGILDITDMGDRVKNMDIVSSSQGNFFFYKSLQEADPSLVVQMLEQVPKYILSY